MHLKVRLVRLIEGRIGSPSVGVLVRIGERLREFYLGLVKHKNVSTLDDDLKTRFCEKPFESFEMQENGSVYLCCSAWLPWRAGNLHAQSADEVWNSERAQAIRGSILDGDFAYCNKSNCPAIQAKSLPTRKQAMKDPRWRKIIKERKTVLEGLPGFINMAHDRSCNLSCPSCRTQKIMYGKGAAYESRKKTHDAFVREFLTKGTDQEFTLSVTGSGDPFGSRIFREFLHEFDARDFPNLKINLQTNGVLFTEKEWGKLGGIHDNVNAVIISFDAATEATYNVTRRGGHWGQLQKNVAFISELRRQGRINLLRLDFVVQKANYREMPDFIEIGKRFGVDQIYFSKAVNWGKWSAAEYRDQCVWNPEHPEYEAFAEIIRSPVFDDPIVYLGNVSEYRRAARDTVALAAE